MYTYKKTKKLFSLLLVVVLVFALMPAQHGYAAGTMNDPDGSNRWYFDDTTPSDSGKGDGVVYSGSWSWNQASATLCLTDFSYSSSADTVLFLPDDSTIMLKGSNTLKCTYSGGTLNTSAIYVNDNLTIDGTGTLLAVAGTGTGSTEGNYGIWVDNGVTSITIKGNAIVTATGNMGAFYSEYVIPAGYTYWRSTTQTPPGGNGNISTGSDSTDKVGGAYYPYKYVRIATDTATVTVTFDAAGGSAVKSQTVKLYETIGMPVTTRAGHNFLGWYNGDKKISFPCIVDDYMTLTAKWLKLTKEADPDPSIQKALAPKKPSLSKIKKNSMLLKYKKVAGSDIKGYVIQYTTDKKFKKGVKTKFTKKFNYTIKGLKKNKKYYVRVAAYKLDPNGKKAYGNFTKPIYKKTKK